MRQLSSDAINIQQYMLAFERELYLPTGFHSL